ncbi:hypothetical protein LINPERHAP1_LOCUS7879 [Linum perenne]
MEIKRRQRHICVVRGCEVMSLRGCSCSLVYTRGEPVTFFFFFHSMS